MLYYRTANKPFGAICAPKQNDGQIKPALGRRHFQGSKIAAHHARWLQIFSISLQ
jgi:hypothetical protein